MILCYIRLLFSWDSNMPLGASCAGLVSVI